MTLRSLLLTVAVFPALLAAQSTDSPEEVQQRVTGLLRESQVTGFSGAYFEDGKIQNLVAAGYADKEAGRPVTERTVFSAASLSKPVLAYLVWQLVDAEEFDLDRPVAEYYSYPDLAHDPRSQKVTARQFLTHHAGLPNWRDGDTLAFQQDPGLAFSYSGEGYVWLQRTLEQLTGRDLAALARERVFEPLGMTRSSFVFEDRFEDDYAVPYNEGKRSTSNHKWSVANAAASLQTTAADYARFLLAVMERSVYLKQQLMVDSAMWNDSPTPPPNTVGWIPGMGVQRTDRGVEFWHWGHNNGFRAYFTILPAEKRGLVFFTNDSTGLDLVPRLTDYAGLGTQPGWRWAGYAPE